MNKRTSVGVIQGLFGLHSKPAACVAALLLFLTGAADAHSQARPSTRFLAYLQSRETVASSLAVHSSGADPAHSFCDAESDAFSARILYEYGAMYSAADSVSVPGRCFFPDEAAVVAFQSTLSTAKYDLDGTQIELQRAAMEALLAARAEAELMGRRISPLDGPVAGKRSFADTVRIWNLRFHRALDHWSEKGKIGLADAAAARLASVPDQARKVMEWEARGWFFNTSFSRTIFQAVAPPGTSQHLSLVAFDVVQHNDTGVREILAHHGWFQTIANDPPHFTYLGVAENELPARGLRAVRRGSRTYWVPDATPVESTPRPTAVRASAGD